jgi:hypothetical protein
VSSFFGETQAIGWGKDSLSQSRSKAGLKRGGYNSMTGISFIYSKLWMARSDTTEWGSLGALPLCNRKSNRR